ncbi:MAG TPA: carboxypeptidase regulatory-like domain-containing protein [Pyrinomonadaceae bacterium]|nr:carboxypeptidase regulatory-like domain-containing protein [Pyrinomonadaceae bacterium]
MKASNRLKTPFVLLLLCALLPLSFAHAAGGRLEGKVTDPKGAIVAGATVTIIDTLTNQNFTAVTDKQGRYKFEGLPAGVYSLGVSAAGFSDARNDDLKIEEGAVVTLDVKLEIAPIEATVTVTNVKANTDPNYQQLRQQARSNGDFGGPFATVTNLVIKRDAGAFTLKSGEIYFTPAVNDRISGAVFFGEGELYLTPPTAIEKHTLSLFTKEPEIKEAFTKLVLHFTDKTFDEIKASPQVTMSTNGAQAARAQDAYRENQALLRRTLRRNVDLRKLIDLYNPQRPGFFTAFIDGKRFNKLNFQYDPLGIPLVSPEEVLLSSYGESDGGLWTAFHRAEEYAKGTASSDEDHRIYDLVHHEIDTVIRGTKLTSTDKITFRQLDNGARVLPFRLFRSMRVTRVKDEAGRDLDFVQEGKNEDADFGVVFPEPLQAGKTYKLIVEYGGGDALIDVGGGNFFLATPARSTWYPNNEGTAFGDRATFDVTYHYPKGKTVIGTGAPVAPPASDGGGMTVKWSSGNVALAVAGFNYGSFKKKELLDSETGYNVEFYANEESPSSMPSQMGSPNTTVMSASGSRNTIGMGGAMLADTQNATRIFNAYFGKLPYTRLALTQQPAGNFGQAWPTLIYMPFTAFLDPTQRYMGTGGNVRAATNNFFEYVAPHEIAHQWWGHMVGWKSYHDQWMSEGFAEFSTSLYVQYVMRDEGRFLKFWNDQRGLIIEARPQTADKKPYTVGPVTQGYRLNSGKTGGVARFMIYPKGAYILHMLRMMMFDPRTGDRHFSAMMQDFIKTHYNLDVSTEDFKRIVEKHMTPQMDVDGNRRMDWFFDAWVYGTEMPSYKFEYQLAGTSLTGKITQSGVSDNFKMPVPVYVDYGSGWVKLGSAFIVGNSTVDLGNQKLPQAVKRVAICSRADILALSITNDRRP